MAEALLGLISLFLIPVSILIIIIQAIRKKPLKRWVLVCLISVLCFLVTITASIVFDKDSAQESDASVSENLDSETEEISNASVSENLDSETEEIEGTIIDDTMPEIKADTFVEKLISFGFNEDEAEENAKILKQCGIPTIDICEPTSDESIDNLVSFRGKLDDDRIFWFTVENRRIFYVSLNGEDLYDEDKGGYLKNFNDVHIPETKISVVVADSLRNKTETVLDTYFASARYYDAWAYGREDNTYMVQCQASDGSLLTDNWIYCLVWYEEQENGDFIVTGVQINGQQYAVK